MVGLCIGGGSAFAGAAGWRQVSPEEAVRAAVEALLAGGVAVFPTDTVYGIAAHPAHPEAIGRIYAAKGRSPGKPMAFLAAGIGAPAAFGAAMPAAAEELARRHWPGALTLVLDCPGGAEGFRVPAHEFARDVIAAAGGLLRVTSANFSGDPPLTALAPPALPFLERADVAIDGGSCPGGAASTVLRVTADGGTTVLRPGPVAI